jgi:hypothetical protein
MSEKLPTTRFYISDEPDSVHFLDGASGTARQAFVSRNSDSRFPLFLFNNLKIKNGDMSVFVGSAGVEIPQKVKNVIADYLQRQAEGKLDNIDCYAFTCLMEGLSIPERDAQGQVREGRLDRWEIAPLDENGDAQPGDVLFFWNASGEDHFQFRHAAVYLDNDTYVSVYGLNGELSFSTFEDLEETFFDDAKKEAGYALYVTKMIPKAQ